MTAVFPDPDEPIDSVEATDDDVVEIVEVEEVAEPGDLADADLLDVIDDDVEVAPREPSPYERPGDWFVVHTYAGYENKVKQNLASRVRQRITAQPVAQPRRLELWRDPRRLALVAAVLLVLLGAAALANPATRDAIAHFFHVRGVIVSRQPSPLPSLSSVTPLDLGRRTTMEDAQSSVSFKIAVPAGLGDPDAV